MMKTLSLVVLAFALALPLRAQIQNGDFTDGTTHWHGDARPASDYAADNPLAATDPSASKGMYIPLKHTTWAKVEQEFKPNAATGTMSITYTVTPDLAISTKPDDFDNVPGKLGWMWKTFKTPPGAWLVSIYTATGDFKTDHISFHPIKPGPAGQPQTIKIPLKDMIPNVTNTLSLDVPPGEGKIIILNVSME